MSLVVEDEPDGRVVVRGLLDHMHISADSARSAEEAMTFLEQQQYDAIILDIALPGMDGLELLTTIRQTVCHDVPGIVITAYHSSQVRKSAFDAGCDVYFPKPIDNQVFISKLNDLIA